VAEQPESGTDRGRGRGGPYPGSRLQISQISMFLAQSGPMRWSLVARSTMEPAMAGGVPAGGENGRRAGWPLLADWDRQRALARARNHPHHAGRPRTSASPFFSLPFLPPPSLVLCREN